MKRLTTAYERKWVDGRTETEYVAKVSAVLPMVRTDTRLEWHVR